MRLFLFGRLRDCGEALHCAEVASDARNVRQLLAWIDTEHPDLSAELRRPGVRFAVDQCFADVDTHIEENSEVALMAPLSGG